MTPKGKAKELVIKIQEEISIVLSRKIALICVDEVIKQSMDNEYAEKYWQEVKEEINKL